MKVGIMGAMPEEIFLLKSELIEPLTETIGGREFHSGQLYGIPTVLVFSRWGKVASTITASILIQKYKIDCLIFVGVAGATAPHLNIGDIVISNQLYQHDMDARPLFNKFQIPLTDTIFFEADLRLIAYAKNSAEQFVDHIENFISFPTRQDFSIVNPTVLVGKIASGDQFISDSVKTNALLTEMPDILAVEMEGAAVAQVCSEYHIPFVVIRVISDKANHQSSIDFQKFISEVASSYSKGIIQNLYPMAFSGVCSVAHF